MRWLWFRRDSWAARKLQDLFRKGIREGVVCDRLPEHVVVPDYPVGCKRILISNDWYPALLRPTVSVVDSPIARIEADAVITADGTRHPADVLIFGHRLLDHRPAGPHPGDRDRGSHPGRRLGRRAPTPTSARPCAGFPNCYLLYGPNTNLGHNSILFMVERQLNLVLQALAAQTRAGTAGSTLRSRCDRGRLPPGRPAHPVAGWHGPPGPPSCTSWYKDGLGQDHQQLADLDRPLLVGDPAAAPGGHRGAGDRRAAGPRRNAAARRSAVQRTLRPWPELRRR